MVTGIIDKDYYVEKGYLDYSEGPEPDSGATNCCHIFPAFLGDFVGSGIEAKVRRHVGLKFVHLPVPVYTFRKTTRQQ